MSEPILVKQLRDQAAAKSKGCEGDPFEWRKQTPEWRAADEIEMLGELAMGLNRKLVLAESRLRAIIHHWDEFGPEHGFAETVDRCRPVSTPEREG